MKEKAKGAETTSVIFAENGVRVTVSRLPHRPH